MDLLSELLTKLDPSGALSSTCSMAAAEAGSSAPPSRYNGEGVAPKKRKLAAEKLETNDDVLKKSKVSSSENENDTRSNKSKSSSAAVNSADLSIAQREERALSALVTYLEQEYGGTYVDCFTFVLCMLLGWADHFIKIVFSNQSSSELY